MEKDSYFRDYEIECKCGCGFILVVPLFLDKVNLLRVNVGHPLRVNSWCRCPTHNMLVGGSRTSSHLKGLAVDLAAPTEYILYRILFAAGQVGFRGIGVGKGFVHLDNDLYKPSGRFWIY